MFVVLHCLFSFSTTLLASSQSSFPLYNLRLSEVSLDGVFSLGQYYEWQMKWGKFDGNKSGFILIYAVSCRFSCPADDCNCKTWARGKASSFPPGQDSTVAGITFDRNACFAHYIESYFPPQLRYNFPIASDLFCS